MEKVVKLHAGLLPSDERIEIFTAPDGGLFMQQKGKTTPYGLWPAELMDFLWEEIFKDREVLKELSAATGSKREMIKIFCETYLPDYDDIPDIDLHRRICNREREVFMFLASPEVEKVAEDHLGMKQSTFNTHRKRIYKKMNFNSRNDLIRFACLKKLVTL